MTMVTRRPPTGHRPGAGPARRAAAIALLVLAALGGAACGGGASDDASSATGPDDGGGEQTTAAPSTPGGATASTDAVEAEEEEETEEEPSETTEAAAGEAGLFDFNDDGEEERTCGQAAFPGGLVVRTYCEDLSGYANDPEEGATLVPGALFAIPGPPDDPRDPPITSGASVSAQHLQAADGGELALYTLTSDTVFATGSSELVGPATDSLTSIARGLAASYPTAAFEVRGHTDATGDAAANQALSEQRAATVAAFLVSTGLAPSAVSSVGLGQTAPNYLEDGQAGRDQNRRVEILVRL